MTNREHSISKKVGKALFDYKMIKKGERVAVAVSGGKDSLALVKILNDKIAAMPIKFKIIAIHIRSDYHCASCHHVGYLTEFLAKNNIEYHIKEIKIMKDKLGKSVKPTCFWCSWNRRKALFETAQKLKCKKIAFGHHKDDSNETLLMNIFFNGEISAIPPKLKMFKGKFEIIRPLCYVEEKELEELAKELNLPAFKCKCPNSSISKRALMKDIISKVESECPHVRTNIFRSVRRIKKEYLA